MKHGALLLGVLLASCGGSSGGAVNGGMCGHPAYLDDAGVGACTLGRAALFCESASQGGCECVTNDSSCGCAIPCVNKCHANEYAAACGGPPIQGDAGASYASPPAACRSVASGPSGGSLYCCPCQ